MGIGYVEKDFYDVFAIRKKRFKIASATDTEIGGSFISILAELKHGINDYTVKDKELVKLSAVLNEINQLTNDNTRFSTYISESANCLEKCFINEGLRNNSFVEKLITNKLPKILKKRKVIINETKAEVKKSEEHKIDPKIKRAESYKQKILKRSGNTVNVLNYVSSREKATAKCMVCGHSWEVRSDHLLARPYCPLCRKVE